LVSCSDQTEILTIESDESKKLAILDKIQKECGLKFSTDSRLVYFSQPDYFVDPRWVSKVIMSAPSYNSFEHVLQNKPKDNTMYQATLASSTEWWRPKEIVLTKQYLANGQTFVRVIVAKEGEEFALYIECVVS